MSGGRKIAGSGADPRARQRGLERGLLADGLMPVSLRHFLVEAWRLQAAGRDTEAHELLMEVWSRAMDADNMHAAPAALRLLKRFGFVSDDQETWSALPDELTIYRAESEVDSGDGYCWTLDRAVAEMFANRFGLAVSIGTVRKRDVLAYITQRSEEEVVVPKERVRNVREVRL